MQPYDYTPFHRSSVGFDRLFQLLDSATGNDTGAATYPPYNIENIAENEYRISMAVAGFSKDEISIEAKEAELTVQGEKADKDDKTDGRTYLHRGIAARSFERRFQLADHVEVTGADLVDGMLLIDLERKLPERLKPRSIAIGDGATKQLEAAE